MGREFRVFQGLSLALPLSYLMSCMWGASLICSLIKGLEMAICFWPFSGFLSVSGFLLTSLALGSSCPF